MEGKPAKLYFALFFLLALICFSAQKPPRLKDCCVEEHSVFTFQANEPVKGELHRVSQTVSASGTSVFRDQVDPSGIPQPAASRSLALTGKISLHAISSFPLKEYLSHIYPSHNFW